MSVQALKEVEFVSLPVFRRKHRDTKATRIADRLIDRWQQDDMPTFGRGEARFVVCCLGLRGKLATDAVFVSADDFQVVSDFQDRKKVRRFAVRMVENRRDIARGWPVSSKPFSLPPTRQRLVVVGYDSADCKHPRIAYRVETGPAVGRQVVVRLTAGQSAVLYMIATGNPRGCRYRFPKQLMGLQLAGIVESTGGSLEVKDIAVSKSQLAANVRLVRSRQRNLSKCPFNVAVDCILCSVGTNECSRSMLPIVTNLVRHNSDESRRVQ